MKTIAIMIALSLSSIFSIVALATTEVPIHVTPIFATEYNYSYRDVFVHPDGSGVLISKYGFTNVVDGQYTTASKVLANAGVTPNDSVIIKDVQFDKTGRTALLKIEAASSYGMWQNCMNVAYEVTPSKECFHGEFVIDLSSLKIINQIYTYSDLNTQNILTKAVLATRAHIAGIEAQIGETLNQVSLDYSLEQGYLTTPILSTDGDKVLFVVLGKSEATYLVSYDLNTNQYTLQDKINESYLSQYGFLPGLAVIAGKDNLMFVSRNKLKSFIVDRQSLRRRADVAVGYYKNALPFLIEESDGKLIVGALDDASLTIVNTNTGSKMDLDLAKLGVLPPTGFGPYLFNSSISGSTLNIPLRFWGYHGFCGNSMSDDPISGYQIDLTTFAVKEIPCKTTLNSMFPDITIINDGYDVVKKYMMFIGKENGVRASFIVNQSSGNLYKLSDPKFYGFNQQVETDDELIFIDGRGGKLSRIKKSDIP